LAAALEARGLWKRYREGGPWVLAGLDLVVEPGEAVAVVGANGSGKTTLLRIAAGLLHASKGTVLVYGHKAGSVAARRVTGAVLHHSLLYDDLTVAENLEYYAGLYDVEDYDPARDPNVEALGLQRYLHARARELSFGWRRRADLARALLHGPRLILIDEPFTGLDDRGVRDGQGPRGGRRRGRHGPQEERRGPARRRQGVPSQGREACRRLGS